MKNIKIFVAILVVATMLLTNTATIFAYDYDLDDLEGFCGDDLEWHINPDTGVLTISGYGEMYDGYTEPYWYNSTNLIKTVVFDGTITTIGDYAFYGCTALESITIPDTVTSIGKYSFCGASALAEVNISNSAKTIGEWAFAECYSLKEVTIPASVWVVGDYAFDSCYYIENYFVDDANPNYVGENGVLYSRGKETVVFYPNANTRTSFTVPNTVTTIEKHAFAYAYNLESIILPSSVTTVEDYAFESCTALNSITVRDSVKNIGRNVFFDCNNLTIHCDDNTPIYEYAVKQGIPTAPIEDNDNFDDIIYDISGECGEDLKWYFNNEKGVLKISGTGSMYSYDYNSLPWYEYSGYINAVIIDDSVTSICTNCFNYFDGITYVYIGESVESIGSAAFAYDDKLESVIIPASVSKLGFNAFFNCSNLKNVTILNPFMSIGNNAFYNTNVTIKCYENSTAHKYAVNNGLNYELISCDHVFSEYVDNNDESCTSDATETAYCDNGCGNTDTRVISGTKLEHIYTAEVVTTASCTKNGMKRWKCTCGDYYTEEIPAIPHRFENYFYNEDATCTNNGTMTAWCEYGCDTTDTIIAEGTILEHSYESIVDAEPSCVKAGVLRMQCDCSYYYTEEIPVIPHVFDNYEYNNDATCMKDGTKTAYCEYGCGTSETVTAEKTAIPHIFENYTYNNDSTCTKDGTKTAYCEYGCGTSDTVTAEGTASHVYITYTVDEPTCSTQGVLVMECECGDYYVEYTPVVPHKFDYVYNGDATCTADGTKTGYCNFGCGTIDTTTAENTMKPHDFRYYEYNNDATCVQNGTATASCEYGCGAMDTVIAQDSILPHVFKYYFYNNDATCTKDGTETAYCEYGCGTIETQVIWGSATGHDYILVTETEPTCSSVGEELYICSACNDSYSVEKPLLEHTWKELELGWQWRMETPPTETDPGTEKRICVECGFEEIRAITEFPAPFPNPHNYKIAFHFASYIKDIRYVAGEYHSIDEIRNALGNVALSNSVVVEHTNDRDVFEYEMPDGGEYSVWVRMYNGKNYIYNFSMTRFYPDVTADGVNITVEGLYDVKDCFIAKGEFDNYNEIKNNGYIVRLTSNKIAGKHNYTYTVTDPGMHTILVRYNDGSEYIFHEELTVDEPVFTTNGLQVTVSNIPDVKVIRTAYGEYYTPGDTKRAEGARNFSNKAVIKDAESYMLQYREEGRVTIIVEYNNGYVKVFHYDVTKKVPTMEQDGNTVTFGELDGLVMIRYAMGEYATSSEIKKAPGSKVIKSDAIVDGKITVTDLAAGTYTFCVQFDDESYNYYTIMI